MWANALVYQLPKIVEPVAESVSEVSGVIRHFAKPATLRQYNNPSGFDDNGLLDAGDYRSKVLWCVIKPAVGAKGLSTQLDERGFYDQGMLALYYDPYHPQHNEPIHITPLSDNPFSDIVEYQGDLWVVRSLLKLELSDGRYIGKATIEKWLNPKSNQSNPEIAAQAHYRIK